MNVSNPAAKLALPRGLPELDRVPCRPRQKTQSFSLGRSEVMTFDLPPVRRFVLELNEGRLWVTLENDPADHVIQAGETLRFSNPGKLVIEALAESKFICGI